MKNYLLRVSLMGILAMFYGIVVAQSQYPITATWDFQTPSPAALANVNIQQTNEADVASDVEGVVMHVISNGGKLQYNASGYAQFNTNTTIQVPVGTATDVVTVVSYPGQSNYTVGGEDATGKNTFAHTATTAEVAQGYVEITPSSTSYLYSIQVVLNEPQGAPVQQDVTGTWDYSNADVMSATMAFSGSNESGVVEDVEKNGLKMTIVANGASFHNNGNNIQVASGAEFRIPVISTEDVVTVKGYPNYSYYTIAGGDEITNTNDNPVTTYKAKASDVAQGYVVVKSTNNNNYFYLLKVEQKAPQKPVQLDNEAATITFPFDLGTDGQTATFSNADYFLNSKVTWGSNFTVDGTRTVSDITETQLKATAKESKAAESNLIKFIFTPKPGFTFTPTKVSFIATRVGTDDGAMEIAWLNWDKTTAALAKLTKADGNLPARESKDPNYTAFDYDLTAVSGVTAGEGECGLQFNLYNINAGKRYGFANIVIEGTLSGAEKELPVLASFKINGNDYSVEEVFGDEFEATIDLPKAQAMVSENNPLTDIVASSGELGDVTYEGTETTCKVTIPLTSGQTTVNYVLNVVFKPDFTLSYMAVDGTTVLATQTVEKDAAIVQFAYNIKDVAASKDGYKARGWFKQDYLGAKYTTADVITADTKLYAIETEIEYPSDSRKYVFDLTNQLFYDEDHEGFNSIGTGYWHDAQHGWAFGNGDKIELLVGPKATINFSLCKYSKAGATIEGSNGASISAVAETDGGAGSFDYEGEAGTLTLTINSEGAVYIHSITVFNTATTNYDKQGDWIIVKQGDASSLLDAIELAKGIENAKIFVPNGTYDLGETVKTIISGKNVSLIGQSAENTIIVNRPPSNSEGLDKADLLKNTGEGLYMQDISLKNDFAYGGNDGRAASLHDTGTKTICKNVNLLSHQDTYYSHKVGGLYYFEGGELHGTVDYLCGNGKVYYNEVKLVNEQRNSATITANSELYVFNNCTVENNANTYNFGRAWSDNPVCIYLNTTLLDGGENLASTRWNLSGINCDYSIAGEYGTKDANGNDITPASNNVTFTKQNTSMNTILDATALETYSIQNVLGDWAATAQESVKQIEAPADGQYMNGMVTWSAVDGASAYALFKNGELAGIVSDVTYFEIEVTENDELTIRSANARGGFGAAAEVALVATGICETIHAEMAVPERIYNLNGMRVQKAEKGLYIINGKKVMK